jgi:hypothetical protein
MSRQQRASARNADATTVGDVGNSGDASQELSSREKRASKRGEAVVSTPTEHDDDDKDALDDDETQTPPDQPDDAPLPPDWVVQTSKTTGLPYWFNTRTGESTYKRSAGGGAFISSHMATHSVCIALLRLFCCSFPVQWPHRSLLS